MEIINSRKKILRDATSHKKSAIQWWFRKKFDIFDVGKIDILCS